MRQRAGGVPPLSYCLRRGCAAAPPCSGAGEPTPVRANLQSWVRWPDGHTFFAFLYTTGPARQRDMGAASRCSPPCAKGGQHGRAMQGGIDSTQLPGRYQVPGVGMVSQVPSIPQSAFADSSLCTREVRWPDGPSAWAVISLLAVLHPTGPFCGTLPGLHPSPFRCWLASAGAGKPAAHPHRKQEREWRLATSVTLPRGSFPFSIGR